MIKYRLFLLVWVFIFGWMGIRAFQHVPIPTLWVLCAAGVVLGMTGFALSFLKTAKGTVSG